MGLWFIDTVTGLGLFDTTTGLKLLTAGAGLEASVIDTRAGLLTSFRLGGFMVLEILRLSTWEISEVTNPPSSTCWIWEYWRLLDDAVTTVEPAEDVGAEQPSSSICSSSGRGVQEGVV